MKFLNFYCAIFLFMKITLGTESAFNFSDSESDLFESTSDTSQINTSESENDEVFSLSTTEEAEFSSSDNFEFVKTYYKPEYENSETLNTFIANNGEVISNCKLENVNAFLPTFDSKSLRIQNTSKTEEDDKIDKKSYLEEFRKDMSQMFFLVQKNLDFSTTKTNLNLVLKGIERDLNNEINDDCESTLNYLKHYSDLIDNFLIFFDDEENDNSFEYLQKIISKVQLKLENIDEIINMIDKLYIEEGLEPLDLIKFREEITRLKELLDEETKHYLNYFDFRRENFRNYSFIIKDKLLELQENFKTKKNVFFFKISVESKNMEPLFDDDSVKDTREFLKGLHYIIGEYIPFLRNYQDALNDIWIFNNQL